MGWNEGYSIMEHTVIEVYNLGVMTKELLNAIMQPYVDTDIDHGGCCDLRANDGISADQIVVKVMDHKAFEKIMKIKDVDEREHRIVMKWFSITEREWNFY